MILFIFFARVIDMSLATMRMILVFRGRRLEGAALGFIEVTVYITALSRIVGSINNISNLIAYSSGFAAGTLVGGYIEEKLALGLLTVHVFPFPKFRRSVASARYCSHTSSPRMVESTFLRSAGPCWANWSARPCRKNEALVKVS